MKGYLPAACSLFAIGFLVLWVVSSNWFAIPFFIFCFLAASTGLKKGGTD